MEIRRGKPIDSSRLKVNVDKTASIEAARLASTSISPGPEMVHCPVCRGIDLRHLAVIYGFRYAECAHCGTAFVRNPPAESDLRDLYSSEYYTSSNKKLYASESVLAYRLENIARPKVRFVLDAVGARPSSWLDIGCGTAEILKVAKDTGLMVEGIETNKMQRDFAASEYGIAVHDEFVTPGNITKFASRFDVISLFSVLEHVPDPDALVATISSCQEAGQHLVIEVPHFPSLSAASQIAFPDLVNRMMHPPLHLFLFSISGIKLLLNRHGYDATHCWMFGQDAYEFLSTLCIAAPQMADSSLTKTLQQMIGPIQQIIDDRELSDEMLLVAKKVG